MLRGKISGRILRRCSLELSRSNRRSSLSSIEADKMEQKTDEGTV